MSSPARVQPKGRMTLGFVLIAIGVVLTLDQAGILGVRALGWWWPLLLIGAGVVKVRQPLEDGQRALGVALLFMGVLFQILSLSAMGSAWPLVMIGIGGFLLWRAADGPRAPVVPPESPFLSDMILIGHLKRAHAAELRGGHVTAVMGGLELDLRNARIAGGTAYLDVFVFWGGIDLKLPAGWTVDAQVVPIMAGFENNTLPPAGPASAEKLVVRGHVIMGAVVVGN